MMKSLLTAGIFAFVCVFSAKAQEGDKTAAPNPNAPVIKFTEEVHDYGTIPQGADGTYFFKFKNTGKEPLIITNARGSCGCTVPEWPKEPIVPGGEGKIKVTYDTKRVGPFTKTVTLSSNAVPSDKVLTIKGNVTATPPEETFPTKKNMDGMPFEKNN